MLDIEKLRSFHTQRREKKISVTWEKSPVPMLWLDTSVLIDLAKIANKERIEDTRSAKLSRLKEIVRAAVRAGKLICPEWDQSLEFEGRRLEPQIRRIVVDLSCGVHCATYIEVQDKQIIQGLKAYLAFDEAIHIPAAIHFHGDPASAIREAIRNGFIVDANMPKPAEWIARAESAKSTTKRDFEVLRKKCRAKKQTFEQQLALERIGDSDAMLGMVRDYIKDVGAGKHDFWGYMGVLGFFSYQSLWDRMGGPGPALAALYSFMRSPYYWELPSEDIACRLSADLVVGHTEVKSGDSRDIYNLATSIPVAQYVVADKAMVDRCERLGIGSKWNTKLFSSRTLDKLCEEVESLV
jgi:hypothetical protein